MTTHMIPPFPRYYDPASQENLVYDALHKGLTDEFYVLHSFRLADGHAKTFKEVDFIIYHRRLGILCLEVKAGTAISYRDGMWFYSDGVTPITKTRKVWDTRTQAWVTLKVGPYQQAESAQYAIGEVIRDLGLETKCRIGHAVWFIGLSRMAFCKITASNQEGELKGIENITLLSEDRHNPLPKIEAVYENAPKKLGLTEADERLLFDRFLKPEFNIVPRTYAEHVGITTSVLQMLTLEQVRVLDFLEGQRSVVVNGTAGTGKTFLAREKAVREAQRGKKVLFLCYNHFLRERLTAELRGIEGITVSTLHGLCTYFKVERGDWTALYMAIEAQRGKLPWDHVVIDEGQDFAWRSNRTMGDEGEVLYALEKAVLEEDIEDCSKTFTVFYDRHQLVQGDKSHSAGWRLSLPDFIQRADCKLTLYRNCRNTENVAKSFMGVKGLKAYLYQCAKPPLNDATHVHFVGEKESYDERLQTVLDKEKIVYMSEGGNVEHNQVVVVSAATCELKSTPLGKAGKLIFSDNETGRAMFAGTGIPVYTARTFKGLESDCVVVVDVDPKVLLDSESEEANLFYTAASRAKFSLKIVLDWSVEQCKSALGNVNPEVTSLKKLGKEIARRFSALSQF